MNDRFQLHLGLDFSVSASSEDCFKLAKSWLHTCIQTHNSCATWRRPHLPTPTRLVDVGSSTVEPRLYIPNKKDKAAYIALSHCWGTEKPPIRTTSSNLESMCRGIPFSDLPRNF